MPQTTRIAAALSDRYLIEREIGAGGMATVYLARDKKHDRDVALKILRADLSAVLGSERFLNEVRITARLDHPHILTLIDSGEADGILYYVLPFVRGESLRGKLEREKQLGLEESLAIIRQIAGALDYAHQQGVVHRDIKPENILLHEGEAMLADFGIALAVKEAGGNRLTETGLSLGTPQYMSPEQATGDRRLDARSDVYSLAAVLYELLAGEPPVTGPTSQSMIAKLITERPTSLRVVRDTVPVAIDEAVLKALSKVPADRFASAGEFMRAVDAGLTGARSGAMAGAERAPGRGASARWSWIGVLVVVAAIGAAAVLLRKPAHHLPVTLTAHTQLTLTGNVFAPSISPDGKQLAYFSKACAASDCTYALQVQDVGGTTTRPVLDRMSAAYSAAWSPDRRNLIIVGTIGGRWGTWLVSALGGTPRFIGAYQAAFFAGGDSLLIGSSFGRLDTALWARVQTLDGGTRDSIRISAREPFSAATVFAVPGTRWLVAGMVQSGKGLWQVIDRQGHVRDQVTNSCTCGGSASADALWLQRASGNPAEAIVRIGLDSATGRLLPQQDTMYQGIFSGFSITADGGTFVVDEGTYDNSVWVLGVADALGGRFTESQRVVRTSTPVWVTPSPDGARILLTRDVPSGSGRTEERLSVRPLGGGAETVLNTPGPPRTSFWVDPLHVGVASSKGHGQQFSLIDVRSNTVSRSMDVPDSVVADWDALPDGWAWIPSTYDRVITVRAGKRSELMKPANVGTLIQVVADQRGVVYTTGWNAGGFDSLMVLQVPSDSGPWTVWTEMFGEHAATHPLNSGGLDFSIFTTQQSASLFTIPSPGKARKLGTIPRPVDAFFVSRDGRHASVGVRDYHGDAWMSQVVRP